MIGKSLEELLPLLEYKILTLNIMNGKNIVLSKTIMFNRVTEIVDDRCITVENGNGDINFLGKKELKNFKCVRIENDDIHYVFQYDLQREG